MIVTLTANPAIDRAIRIDRSLRRGDVHRAISVCDEAGGKGVNVARALAHAGVSTVAILPADDEDLLVRSLREVGAFPVNVSVGTPARLNIKVIEPDGSTTTFNDPGVAYPKSVLAELGEAVVQRSGDAAWTVLSGSLPPGAPIGWYAELTALLHAKGRRVAVDTSGAPLAAILCADDLPDLLKPNAEELASTSGADPDAVDAPFAAALAARLVERGVGAVLATLGGRGAVLVTNTGAWCAPAPEIVVRSTVGAGDASLAGYLIAEASGLPEPQRLSRAVAYGAAAASLPGVTMPRPADVRPYRIVVETLVPFDPSRDRTH